LEKKPVIVQTKKMDLLQNIDHNNLPRHLAIIMDGNGRWAKQQVEAFGHERDKISKIIMEACANYENLTLYAFLPKTGTDLN
jgi:undecaprenyl diphosphate synthase